MQRKPFDVIALRTLIFGLLKRRIKVSTGKGKGQKIYDTSVFIEDILSLNVRVGRRNIIVSACEITQEGNVSIDLRRAMEKNPRVQRTPK